MHLIAGNGLHRHVLQALQLPQDLSNGTSLVKNLSLTATLRLKHVVVGVWAGCTKGMCHKAVWVAAFELLQFLISFLKNSFTTGMLQVVLPGPSAPRSDPLAAPPFFRTVPICVSPWTLQLLVPRLLRVNIIKSIVQYVVYYAAAFVSTVY